MKRKLLFTLLFGFSLLGKSQSWFALGTGVDQGGVNALVTDTVNNLLYVGGAFQNATGLPVYYIASWNGTNWDSLGSGMNFYVNALEMYNGELYAGGSFNFAGGNSIPYLAKWNGNNWSSVSTSITTTVTDLAVNNDTLYGVMNNSQIFKWDGNNLTLIPGPGGGVWAIGSYNNDLIAGGNFASSNYIAKWDGNIWSQVGNGFNSYVHSLKTYNGYLYAGGEFTFTGPTPANSIAKWDGNTWTALGSGITGIGYSAVFAMAGNNNILYVGGNFNYAGGPPANYIAQWNGSNWGPLGVGVNNGVEALAIYNGELYEGGGSQYAGGNPVNYIARWGNVTSVENQQTIFSASVFPNPVSNDKSFQINFSETNAETQLEIFSVGGQLVYSQQIPRGETSAVIPENLLSSGIYLVKMSNGNFVKTEKLVVE